ncbi:hypothetical protein FSP39_000606 [Pinctada imbricata]|uniref:BTB domain-containing protein n=1 Tax=Pinctada imbricata TaxID=66713 RepID=A0AA89C4M7_PINIB|nr:hypothetical protein FSP39_000606 [Pinctada imbricata]
MSPFSTDSLQNLQRTMIAHPNRCSFCRFQPRRKLRERESGTKAIMNCYQKFYTNQIHSSSLLCQLATMWKSQVLCDAIIKSGTISIKAHRVVLVAACPMLQSMENASIGSHLEVRLASDIKEESINTFLQYLYEGFMLLTEENCKDVEKIGRLLQVDSVIKCCADFFKCLSKRSGSVDLSEQYRYNAFNDTEYKHVRSSKMLRTTQDRHLKRRTSFSQPSSPGSKRQRFQGMSASRTPTTDDTFSMSQSYAHTDTSDRIPRGEPPGIAKVASAPQPGVINIVEDSLELVQTDPSLPNRSHTVDQRSGSSSSSFSVGISSRIEHDRGTQILNISENNDIDTSQSKSRPTPPNRLLPAAKSVIPLSVQPAAHHEDGTDVRIHHGSVNESRTYQDDSPDMRPHLGPSIESRGELVYLSPLKSLTKLKTPFSSSSPKPFAVGSPIKNVSETSTDSKEKEETRADKSSNEQSRLQSHDPPQSDPAPDIGLVKIEQEDSDLEMYVSMSEEGRMKIKRTHMDDNTNNGESNEAGDYTREESPGDLSSMSGLQDNSWLMDQSQFTGHGGNASLHESLIRVGPLDPDLSLMSDAANLKLLTGQIAVDFHFVLNDDMGRPYVYIDKDSCRYVYNESLPELEDSTNVTVMSYSSFRKIDAIVGEMNISEGHFAESLKGKQKYCILCKQVGRKTNDGLIGVRTRTKCRHGLNPPAPMMPVQGLFAGQDLNMLWAATSARPCPVNWPIVVENSEGKPFVVIDKESCRFITEEEIPNWRELSILTYDNYCKLESYLNKETSHVHDLESLMGKQKNCIMCKYLGRKTKDGTVPVRSRLRCKACDVGLCKGAPRNCFQLFHQLFKLTSLPDLNFAENTLYVVTNRRHGRRAERSKSYGQYFLETANDEEDVKNYIHVVTNGNVQSKPLMADGINRLLVLQDSLMRPLVSVNALSGRYAGGDNPEDFSNRDVTYLSNENFEKIKNTIGNVDLDNYHVMEGLGGKQKVCLLCKFVGSKTNEGMTPVRTRVKCKYCDIALCRGSPRYCFQMVHQLLKNTMYPDLKF